MEYTASVSFWHLRVRTVLPLNVLRLPTPINRSFSMGWSKTPSTGFPFRPRPIRVPNIGRPAMNALVPSMGSNIQHKSASGFVVANSSPTIP